jgi:hypothetical protein
MTEYVVRFFPGGIVVSAFATIVALRKTRSH